ncbi:MAG: hypothetical protein E7335_08100 [Clostridiales bacterium]|nr:hypothetical protein [Clostridiales bacterium]
MKFRKSQIAALLLIVLALVAGACMNTASPQATPGATMNPFSGAPTATGIPAPVATVAPANQESTGTAVQNGQNGVPAQKYDWMTNADTIENRIGQISEIAECRIVVSGNTALVGVRFTPQYKGEMTERIREMIAGQIKAADPTLQIVAVTANEEDVTRIYEISDAVKAGQSIDELDSDIDTIVRNTTTMR